LSLFAEENLESHSTRRVKLQIDVVGEAGVFHDDSISLAGVLAEQLMERGVSFKLTFDIDSQ
jgi:hypothetical protein